MKNLFCLLALLGTVLFAHAQKNYKLSSPDGDIQLSVTVSDKIYYDIACQNETLLEKGTMQMQIGKQMLGDKPRVVGKVMKTVNETIHPVVPFKFSTISNHYNQLLLKFSGNYSVEFRAFDDGIAYRFITNKKVKLK